jgi:hypothetical protein
LGEDSPNVGKESWAEVLSGGVGIGGEMVEGVKDALGPVAANDLGDGKEGTPVVGEAVAGGQRRVAGGDGVEVVLGPAGDFAAEEVLGVEAAFVEAELKGARGSLDEGNDNGTVAECGGEMSETGQSGGGKGLKGANVMAFAAVDAGVGVVASIEEAAQVGVEVEVGIDLVEEESGLKAIDDAEEDSGFEIVGAEAFGGESGQEAQGGGFAAARFGGGEVEAGSLGKGADGMGMKGPEGENDGGARREVKVKESPVVDEVEESRSVGDRFRPGNELMKLDGVGLSFVIEGTGALDGIVEGAEAEVEAFGLGAADEVVVKRREFGEASEGLRGIFDF